MARSKNSEHHRRPRSTGGSNAPENISWVTEKKHRAYHLLFENKNPQAIAEILSKIWIDPAWYLVACKRRNRRRKKK